MPRERYIKEREDYREGGRVALARGGRRKGASKKVKKKAAPKAKKKVAPKAKKVKRTTPKRPVAQPQPEPTVQQPVAQPQPAAASSASNMQKTLGSQPKKGRDKTLRELREERRLRDTEAQGQPIPQQGIAPPVSVPVGTSGIPPVVPSYTPSTHIPEVGYDFPAQIPAQPAPPDPSTVAGSWNIDIPETNVTFPAGTPNTGQEYKEFIEGIEPEQVAPNRVTNEDVARAAEIQKQNALQTYMDDLSKAQSQAIMSSPRGDAWRTDTPRGGSAADVAYGADVTASPTAVKEWENWRRRDQGLTTDAAGNPLPFDFRDELKADLALRSQLGRAPNWEEVQSYLAKESPERVAPSAQSLAEAKENVAAGTTATGTGETITDTDTGTTTDTGQDWVEAQDEIATGTETETDTGTTTGTGTETTTGTETGTTISDSEAYARQLAAGQGQLAADSAAVIPDAAKVGDVLRDADGVPILDDDGNEQPIVAGMEATKMGKFFRDESGELIRDVDGNPIPMVRDVGDQAAGVPTGLPIVGETGGAEDVATGVATEAFQNLPQGYKFTANPELEDMAYPAVMPPEGQRWAYNQETGDRIPVPEGVTERISADTYTAKEVSTEDILFDPATGAIREGKDTAELTDKALTLSATGVDFTQEQKDRGMIEPIVGTLSPEAKADLVKVAGTTLPRVLRAKKQLRRAGLSEGDIDEFANDPEALEEKILEYTEAERGMIAGLPDEALVSTQINALLDGMESGEIPTFAKPAVAAVNQMLAERGLDASTVGRDALFNAIIQAAVPIAQSNAQSIKEAVMQQKGIEAQAEQLNAQMAQQTALQNANTVFQMDMAQFSADQQRVMANGKFLQTTSLTEVTNDQQAAIQNAIHQTQLDVANLSTQEKLALNNAQAFLSMNMANVSNDQQGRLIDRQTEQQRMLSNQSAVNAARQFNSTSENQTNQFMASLNSNMTQFNATQQNAMSQFNATAENQAEARRFASEVDVSKFNAQLATQIDQYNAQQDFAVSQWEAQNGAMVEASNVEWRRKANTANTAIQNQINMQNAQNAFNMSTQSLAFLWQRLRDQADFDWRATENQQNREAQIITTAIANEGEAGKTYDDFLIDLVESLSDDYEVPAGMT